jgi:hypothetical protein
MGDKCEVKINESKKVPRQPEKVGVVLKLKKYSSNAKAIRYHGKLSSDSSNNTDRQLK